MTTTKNELEAQVERLAGRVEFWQLRALVAESRVRMLEDAVRGHRSMVGVRSGDKTDRELWGAL